MQITVLSDRGIAKPTSARQDGEALWLSPPDVDAATGWTIKPEGLCRGPECIPAPPDERTAFQRDGEVNIAAFWRRMGAPLAISEARDIWALGERAQTRSDMLESLEAPDFGLPDLDERIHRLSDHRGQKVLLTTWASW